MGRRRKENVQFVVELMQKNVKANKCVPIFDKWVASCVMQVLKCCNIYGLNNVESFKLFAQNKTNKQIVKYSQAKTQLLWNIW